MEIEERKVEIDGLTLGMFVSRLDRPWNETPFALQGFSISDQADIEQLRRYCRHVYIDVEKSTSVEQRSLLQRLGYNTLTRNHQPLPAPISYVNRVSLAGLTAPSSASLFLSG